MKELTAEHVAHAKRIARGRALRWVRGIVGFDEVESIALLGLAEFARTYDGASPFEAYLEGYLPKWVAGHAGFAYEHGCSSRRPYPCRREKARDCHERRIVHNVYGDAPLGDEGSGKLWDVFEDQGRIYQPSSVLYGADPADLVCAMETMREYAADLAARPAAPIAPISDPERIVRAYAEGSTLDEIATELGVSRDRVYRVLRKRGVAMRKRGSVNGWTRVAA